ncbi:uncharacterized protein LOC105930640 [Fundulus heteroclitus]|uniref:uncharacterized protein LOC105930640 n=1 Tax=Fundulus heteroclitus TaxID=8078 RepID=UPI00165B2646|nr:uncharacterized protein LOC105930640 [Fundulus heteroclitus]
MMAGLASTGLWLLVILTGAINGYPAKTASSHPGASSANPPFGSSGVEPAPGSVPAKSAFPTAQFHPDAKPGSIHPGAPIKPVPAHHGSDAFPAPGHQGFAGGSQVGSIQPRLQSPPSQVQWAVAPPSPFSGRPSSPVEPSFVSEGPGYVSPPGPFPLLFRPGETSYEEKMYEQGEYDSESQDKARKLPAQYFPVLAQNEFAVGSPLALSSLVDRLRLGYPLMEYLWMTRRYPPGTYTFSTDQLEHRKNHWHDSRHIGDPYRYAQKQLEPLSYPRGIQHPFQPLQQRVGNAGYGLHDIYG